MPEASCRMIEYETIYQKPHKQTQSIICFQCVHRKTLENPQLITAGTYGLGVIGSRWENGGSVLF